MAAAASGSGNRPGFTEGEVTVDYDRIDSPELAANVGQHLASLEGDPSVNQASLGLARVGVGFHYTRMRLAATITTTDVANGVMHHRFYQSQTEVAIFGGAVFGVTGAAYLGGTAAGYSGYVWSSLPANVRHELIAMGLDIAAEVFVPNGKFDTSTSPRIKYEHVLPVRPRKVPAIIPRP